MEDIFVVKRCKNIIIYGRRAGDSQHDPADAHSWFRICDTRTNGFIGDGYEKEEDAQRECKRLNAVSSPLPARAPSG
ncbi:hypothetical protein [Pseudomonas fluorescens]|uniref:Uncharacterized protein n=1 Tax=Pseudomonas fluorescens TaxID=294 RepID=A0A5E6UJ26_PSEFL|nr:hypothetical protein [Pseudomonas fluorescens]VVN05610.1 hypothetical protein PS655_03576 [Pseudomonas fluorescens]